MSSSEAAADVLPGYASSPSSASRESEKPGQGSILASVSASRVPEPRSGPSDALDEAGPMLGPATSFHIYKVPGYGFNIPRDSEIKAHDKETVEYYLHCPYDFLRSLLGAFEMTLHRSSATGPAVATIRIGVRGKEFQIKFVAQDGRDTVLRRKGLRGRAHEFTLRDEGRDRGMVWKNGSTWLTADWVCTNEDNGEIAARWRRINFAKTKAGHMTIMPNYTQHTEVLLTTALATDEWARREQGLS